MSIEIKLMVGGIVEPYGTGWIFISSRPYLMHAVVGRTTITLIVDFRRVVDFVANAPFERTCFGLRHLFAANRALSL